MPVLDGRPVPASAIDPARHRYVGMWRSPEPPDDDLAPVLKGAVARAWAEGRYDVPQYATIVQDAGWPQTFTEACENCRFFTDHKEAPGECRAHPEPVEKFSFHWCGEWEPR